MKSVTIVAFVAFVLALSLSSLPAKLAYSQPNPPPNPVTILCQNAQGAYVPASPANPCPSSAVAGPVSPVLGTGMYSSANVTTTDSVLTIAAHTQYLDLLNLSATATICVAFGATATITGSQCGGGEWALNPVGGRKSWPDFGGGVIPQDVVHVIASANCTGCLTVGAK